MIGDGLVPNPLGTQIGKPLREIEVKPERQPLPEPIRIPEREESPDPAPAEPEFEPVEK